MKRTLSMILIVAMLVSLFGCAAQPVQTPKAEQLLTKGENTVNETVDQMNRDEKEWHGQAHASGTRPNRI